MPASRDRWASLRCAVDIIVVSCVRHDHGRQNPKGTQPEAGLADLLFDRLLARNSSLARNLIGRELCPRRVTGHPNDQYRKSERRVGRKKRLSVSPRDEHLLPANCNSKAIFDPRSEEAGKVLIPTPSPLDPVVGAIQEALGLQALVSRSPDKAAGKASDPPASFRLTAGQMRPKGR